MNTFIEKNLKLAQSLINHLSSFEYSFNVITTSRTVSVEFNNVRIFHSELILSKRSLGMIKLLRKEVLQRMNNCDTVCRAQYVAAKRSLEKRKNLIEYDLTAAYLHALHDLKLCSNDLYVKLLDVKKEERLAIVGSLATKKVTIPYVSGKEEKSKIETQPTEPAWWTIVNHVDRIMFDLMNRSEVEGYWVDAIWTTRDFDLHLPFKRREVIVETAQYDKNKLFLKFNDGREFNIPSRSII